MIFDKLIKVKLGFSENLSLFSPDQMKYVR